MTGWPWDLPDGWSWSRWGDVAQVASALTDPGLYPSLPHIAPNHIESHTGRLLPYKSVAEDGVFSPKHHFYPGQVLYSKIRPYLAKVALAEFEGLCSADMYPVTTDLVPTYLQMWMLSPEFTRLAAREQARTVLPKINVRSLSALPVPLPPLDEQRRIVAILEDHLSRLDAATESVSRARRLLRHAIDAEATQLVRPRSGWTEVRMKDIVRSVRNGIFISRPTAEPDGVPILRIGAVRALNLSLDDLRYTQKRVDQFDREKELLAAGDLLFTRYNGNPDYVAACAVVPDMRGELTFPDKLIRVRLDVGRVDPCFVALAVSMGPTRQFLRSRVKTTAGQAGIAGTDLKDAPLWLPDLAVQVEIATTFERLTISVAPVERAIEVAERRSAQLRQSLLSAAFSGELTRECASV